MSIVSITDLSKAGSPTAGSSPKELDKPQPGGNGLGGIKQATDINDVFSMSDEHIALAYSGEKLRPLIDVRVVVNLLELAQ